MASHATDPTALGRLVREQRAKLHLTQAELAARVGVSRSAISELEAGRIEQPRATVFARLAAALGIPAAALLAAAGYPTSQVLLAFETDELAVLAASLASLAGTEREWLRARLIELRDTLTSRRAESSGDAPTDARTPGAPRDRSAPRR